MSNLADLLPAGGGQNNTEFVADGNISAGAPVILTSDGKAAPISSTSGVVGASATFESATTSETDAVYDSNSNKIVVVYADQANSYYATSVVGTITGGSTNTVSWGTPVVFVSYGCSSFAPVFQSHDNQIVCAFVAWGGGYSSRIQVIAGEVSGTSMNWYSSGAHDPDGSTGTNYISAAYDSNEQKTVLAWVKGSASTESCVVSVSGTGTSANATTGTVVQVNGGGDARNTSCCFDSNSNKMVVLFNKVHDSYKGFGRVGTVSGTSISYGTEAQFMSGKQPLYIGSGFDASANKIVITGADNANNSQGDCCLGTVSGTDITYSTPVVFSTGGGSGVSSGQNANGFPTIYNPDTTKTFIAFSNGGDDSSGQYIEGTVSGSTISFGSVTTFEAPVSGQTSVAQISAAYDTNVDRFLVAFVPYATGPSYGVGRVIQVGTSTLTSTNLLGLAPEAISDTATGTINTWGSRCENNDFFGTVTATYGSPTAASAYQSESKVLAYDSANNRLVMAYKDGGNSDYGTAVVGELSGTSITWGTPVVFESATTGSDGMDIAFDSNVNRIVIAYQDQENSSYGTAIVGSVSGSGSGSTIAFGSPTIFESADTRTLAVTFDSNDNRIVIVYSDAGNSFYATYVIGTVTTGPDAISFNTPALLNGSSATYETSASFDATENKVLVAYTDDSYDLYVLNLAISSGSGTPGTASSFGTGSPQQRFPRCVYDSVNGKSGVAYAEGTNLPIYFSVISMSGSNVTIETRVLAGDTSDSNYFMHNIAFDASIGQLAICTRDASASKGIVYYGSISGTTSSWTTSGSLFADETILPYGVDVAYDTSANKLAFVYSPLSGSNSEAVVGTLATTTLTIGSDYYVQTDGTLSTDTGGQLIGNAIKTNQINIKDYTG